MEEKEELPRLGPFVWVSSRLWLTFAVGSMPLETRSSAFKSRPQKLQSSKRTNDQSKRGGDTNLGDVIYDRDEISLWAV